MAEFRTKTLIIGSGPAGYTAGIYAARSGLEPILLSGEQVGGQLTITTDVENYPGFPEPIYGTELMDKMRAQAEKLGVKLVTDTINEVDFSVEPFVCTSENNNVYTADTVIIATGASAKWLHIPSETKYIGFGVSGCATCDGFFYRNKDVAVIGGGNTAVEEALYLGTIAKSVTLIHRRDTLRADKTMQERLINHKKIKVEWDSVVEEFIGTDNPKSLTGIKIKNIKTDNCKELKVEGAFIAIGHSPNTGVFRDCLDLDKEGYIITGADSCKTGVPGVYAAGDVQNPKFRQAIIAAGSGCVAALEAERYLVSK